MCFINVVKVKLENLPFFYSFCICIDWNKVGKFVLFDLMSLIKVFSLRDCILLPYFGVLDYAVHDCTLYEMHSGKHLSTFEM